MRRPRSWFPLAALAAATAAVAGAPAGALAQEQQPASHAGTGPAVQRIATASAISDETFGSVFSVRELPDGRILANDGLRRRLVLMDTALKTVSVVLDSASGVANTYGTRPGAMIPFRGDTTLFVDPASYAMLVLDPAGKLVRVRSVWRVEHVPYFTMPGASTGVPAADSRGRVIYRVPARPAPPRVRPPPGMPYVPGQPDSAFLVGVDLDTRRADTLGVIRVPASGVTVRKQLDGSYSFEPQINPLPLTDEWAVLPDGTVAFVRGRDYRVEYRAPDGALTSSARLPFPWQRLTDEDKDRLVDSVRTAQGRSASTSFAMSMIQWVNQYGKKVYPPGFKVPAGFTLRPGLPREWALPPGVSFPANYIYACAPGVQPSPAQLAAFFGGSAAGAAAALGIPPGASAMVYAGAPPGGAEISVRTAIQGGPPPSDGPPAASGDVRVPNVPSGAPVRADAPAQAAPGRPTGATPAAGAAQRVAAAQPGAGADALCLPAPVSFTSGFNPPPPTLRLPSAIPAADLPDYRPPLAPGSVRADMDGNLWIRTLAPTVPGGTVFDIVSRAGQLAARLQIPPGYTVVGFGRGKVVYLSMRDGKGIHLARVRLK